jgi:hypothetical protein
MDKLLIDEKFHRAGGLEGGHYASGLRWCRFAASYYRRDLARAECFSDGDVAWMLGRLKRALEEGETYDPYEGGRRP